MKKTFAVIIAALTAMSFAGCDDYSEVTVAETTDTAVTETQREEETSEPAEKGNATIEETVLFDENGVKLTALALDYENISWVELKLLIENNSGEELELNCHSVSVNGYMINESMYIEAADGEKIEDSLTLNYMYLEDCGIDEIADIEFTLDIFDTELENYTDSSVVRICTTAAETFEYTYDDSGEPVYNENDFKIVVRGIDEDASLFGPGMIVYIENKTDKYIEVYTEDEYVNGVEMDAVFACPIAPGKRAVDGVVFFESDLEENKITTIEEVSLYFYITDNDTCETIVNTEPVNVQFHQSTTRN